MEGRCGKTPTGLPKYRVVWADDILTYQEGPFHDIDENTGVTVRVSEEGRKVPKYAFCGIENQWVLEWYAAEGIETANMDINDRYEPIWVFEVGQTPTIKHVEFILNAQFNPQRIKPDPATIVGSPEKAQKDKEFMLDFMENEEPWLAQQLKRGHGAFIDATKRFTNESGNNLQPSASGNQASH